MNRNQQPIVTPSELPQATADGREAALRKLLPYDYSYAKDAGLIDMFYRDPATGEDGLLHTLGGETKTSASGAVVVEGFHHEPSAEVLWPQTIDEQGQVQHVTRVDRTYLEEVKAKKRALFKEYPHEPYGAAIVVNGLAKYTLQKPKNPGEEPQVVRTRNSMFPSSYDALAVLQTIRMAMNHRDTQHDSRGTASNGREVIITQGSAPMLDGETPLNVRMILDAETNKIVTAIPILPSTPGQMRLNEQQARDVLLKTQVVDNSK